MLARRRPVVAVVVALPRLSLLPLLRLLPLRLLPLRLLLQKRLPPKKQRLNKILLNPYIKARIAQHDAGFFRVSPIYISGFPLCRL
jgi:hypothetical protein